MAQKEVIISAKDMETTDELFFLFICLSGNNGLDIDDFYAFLGVESEERKLFLDTHTKYELVPSGNYTVLVMELK